METAVTAYNTEAPASSTIVIVPDYSMLDSAARDFVACLAEEFRTYVITSGPPQRDQVSEYTVSLAETLLNEGVKWATFIGIGSGAAAVQALAFSENRIVRRVVLLDASARVKPGLLQRIIDSLEEFFPLGLPLRSLSRDFDSRPMLHRIHCPSLVLYSSDSSGFQRQQSEMIAERIPNAWLAELGAKSRSEGGVLSEEVRAKIRSFLEIPAKRPQKALRGEAVSV